MKETKLIPLDYKILKIVNCGSNITKDKIIQKNYPDIQLFEYRFNSLLSSGLLVLDAEEIPNSNGTTGEKRTGYVIISDEGKTELERFNASQKRLFKKRLISLAGLGLTLIGILVTIYLSNRQSQ